MAEGGKRPRSLEGSFSKASGDDELLGEMSGDADELFCEASGDADELFCEASGDADESFCDPCKIDKHLKAAQGYCPICNEYLCKTCLGVHRNQKITRAHAILDKKPMPIAHGSVSNQDLCLDVCQKHQPEIIRFYCKAHDEAGCVDCMTLNHSTCKKNRLQDISGGFKNTSEFKSLDQKLQQLHKELEKMEGKLDNNLKNVDASYNSVLHKIASVRKQINEYLDKIEKKIKDEAAQMKTEDETELKTLQTEHQAIKAEIEAMLQTLHNSNANLNSLLVSTKQAKHKLATMEKEINKFKQSQKKYYEFLISNEIENLISAITPLGQLSRKLIHSTAMYNRSIYVNTKQNTEKDCKITDLALLSPDRMVVTDLVNKNVKLIDISNKTVIASYSTASEPRGVTALSTNLIAVTIPCECKIQILNVTSTFTVQNEIKDYMGCCGIAYDDGRFAVSYIKPGRVEIINIQGELLHTIQPKQDKKDKLKLPYNITFGHDTDTVIISDFRRNEVSVVTFTGQVLHTYTHDRLKIPQGIVVTADGELFVCSQMHHCIYAVSSDFKTSNIIRNISVRTPHRITYCDINHRLYILSIGMSSRDSGNCIDSYDLQ